MTAADHTPADYTPLVVSRICHDLVSPLGAIANGLELLTMTGTGPEAALIGESVANANARIRAFRIAFGAAAPGQRVTRAELAALTEDLSRSGRLSIHWPLASDIERREAKLVLLALQCIETLMPWGAEVRVGPRGAGLAVVARSARIREAPDLIDRLAGRGPDTPPEAAHVQFALLPLEAAAQGRPLSVETGDGALTLAF